jgi:hypothetical protein
MAAPPYEPARSEFLIFGFVALAADIAGFVKAGAEEIWIGGASGNWSVNSNRLDGSAPAVGGDATLGVRFTAEGATALTATNDLGNPFTLNQLLLDSKSTALFTLASLGVEAQEVVHVDGES